MGKIKVATNLLDSPAHSGPGRFGRLLAKHIANIGVELVPSHGIMQGAKAYIGSAIIGETTVLHCKRHDIPILLRLDGVGEIFPHGQYNNDFPRVKFSHANADYVIYQSEFARDYVQDATGFTPKKYSVILNGIELPPLMFSSVTPDKVKHRFLSVCNNWNEFRYYNFYHAIYENLPQIVTKYPDFKWIVVGKHDEFRNRAKCSGKVSPMFADKHIEWVGFNPNLQHIRQGCGGVIHIVGKDSCPNSLIESMSYGLPAITWAQSGGPEIAGTGGVAISNYTPESILTALDFIFKDYEMNRMRAYNEIRNRCNILTTAEQYKEAIELCVESS